MTDLATLEMLLMHYAAGSLGPFEALMMASHIALNPHARRKVSAYEKVGGEFVHNETPVAVTAGCLSSVLNRIDALGTRKSQAQETKQRLAHEFGIPPVIYNIIMQAADSSCWEWRVLSGELEYIDITLCPKKYEKKYPGHLRLMRVKPDVQTLQHRHEEGYEMTLVLTGSYIDETGEYKTGDIIILQADPDFSHAPKAGPEGCLCLVLHEEPQDTHRKSAFGFIGRILNKFRDK